MLMVQIVTSGAERVI